MTRHLLVFVVACGLSDAAAAHAQSPAGAQSGLQLGALQQSAVESDPRFRELKLYESQTNLRLANLAAEWKPAVSVDGLLQYQSDVPTPPPFIPGGNPLFLPPKTTVDAWVRLDQRILDSSIDARAAVEKARLAESQARVRSALFALRQDVNDAFFVAAHLQERTQAVLASIAELEARLRETTARIREGAALPADAAAVEAALLQRRQDQEALLVSRSSALKRLSNLTGHELADDTVLASPDLSQAVADARRQSAARSRPEFVQFARTQERLVREQDAVADQDRPRLSVFARGGFGRPGLNFISDEFQLYGLVGLQLHWKAWSWGATARERETLELQQQIVTADEAAFAKGLVRATDGDSAGIDRLQHTIVLDDRIVELREQIARTAEIRFREGAITASEYVDRSTDLLAARIARAGHRVELAETSARFLTALGLEVR